MKLVLSAKENISDGASGVLVASVLEGMAEYYRTCSENSSWNAD